MTARQHIRSLFLPHECPHCEYDRRFPDFEDGGWMQQDNNGPIVSCPMCNDDGGHPLLPQAKVTPPEADHG